MSNCLHFTNGQCYICLYCQYIRQFYNTNSMISMLLHQVLSNLVKRTGIYNEISTMLPDVYSGGNGIITAALLAI